MKSTVSALLRRSVAVRQPPLRADRWCTPDAGARPVLFASRQAPPSARRGGVATPSRLWL